MSKKNPHQFVHNCAFMHNCYSNRVYIHSYCSMCICYCTVTVVCVFVIVLISVCTFFFSLFSVHKQWTQFSFPYLLFPQMHTNKHTHTHTQTHRHRQINRDTQTHPHTNKPTRTNQQRDRLELVGLDRCLIGARGSWPVLDRSSWFLTGA